MAQPTPIETYLNILREANRADSSGITVLIHAEGLSPIEISDQVRVSSCHSFAIARGCSLGQRGAATWLIPLTSIQAVEIRDEWAPEAAKKIADAIEAQPISARRRSL